MLLALAKYCIAYEFWRVTYELTLIGKFEDPDPGAPVFTGWQTAYVRIPIACNLTPDAATDRINEWRRFLAASTDAVERVNEQRLRIRLNASASAMSAQLTSCGEKRPAVHFSSSG